MQHRVFSDACTFNYINRAGSVSVKERCLAQGFQLISSAAPQSSLGQVTLLKVMQ